MRVVPGAGSRPVLVREPGSLTLPRKWASCQPNWSFHEQMRDPKGSATDAEVPNCQDQITLEFLKRFSSGFLVNSRSHRRNRLSLSTGVGPLSPDDRHNARRRSSCSAGIPHEPILLCRGNSPWQSLPPLIAKLKREAISRRCRVGAPVLQGYSASSASRPNALRVRKSSSANSGEGWARLATPPAPITS